MLDAIHMWGPTSRAAFLSALARRVQFNPVRRSRFFDALQEDRFIVKHTSKPLMSPYYHKEYT